MTALSSVSTAMAAGTTMAAAKASAATKSASTSAAESTSSAKSAAPFGTFWEWRIAGNVTLIVVTIVHGIAKNAAAGISVQSAPVDFAEAGEAIPLVERANGIGYVVEFRIHSVLDFAEAHNEANYQDGRYQDQFRGDNESAFVVEKLFQHGHVFRLCAPNLKMTFPHGNYQALRPALMGHDSLAPIGADVRANEISNPATTGLIASG